MTEKILFGEDGKVIEATGELLDYIISWQEQAAKDEENREAQIKAKEAAQKSANLKLLALGLTEAEIQALKN
jgi:hypothetical protein